MLGAAGLLSGGYDVEDDERPTTGNDAIIRAFLRSRANSIEGGTSEVLRNIRAELDLTMALTGCRTLADITRDRLVEAPLPH